MPENDLRLRYSSMLGLQPGYTLTVTTHHCMVRRRLARLRFLMRRPRGRRLLRVVTWDLIWTFYGMMLDA